MRFISDETRPSTSSTGGSSPVSSCVTKSPFSSTMFVTPPYHCFLVPLHQRSRGGFGRSILSPFAPAGQIARASFFCRVRKGYNEHTMSATTENETSDGVRAVETRRVELAVTGMTCAACARRVERGLSKTPGVGAAHVNFATARATVEYDPRRTDVRRLVEAVEGVGYGTPGALTGGDGHGRGLHLLRRRDRRPSPRRGGRDDERHDDERRDDERRDNERRRRERREHERRADGAGLLRGCVGHHRSNTSGPAARSAREGAHDRRDKKTFGLAGAHSARRACRWQARGCGRRRFDRGRRDTRPPRREDSDRRRRD